MKQMNKMKLEITTLPDSNTITELHSTLGTNYVKKAPSGDELQISLTLTTEFKVKRYNLNLNPASCLSPAWPPSFSSTKRLQHCTYTSHLPFPGPSSHT